ncbi:MAG: nitrite/sulfite reductase, partial [Gammaproteobacteria bacterium]|nr:nitrite/sulfite reductase [Gammaproteobacteria bacterium]
TFDRQLVHERVADFREQTTRYLTGELDEEQFKPLRLMNGLYIQRFAPMLRVAIPYGILSSTQLRMLASIAVRYDRGYGHFTTRQNIQFNWPALERVPDILADLASVDMHAIQTSGNCIRNITCDHLAGVTPDEIADPRPYCELLRQWSTLHPEFAYLPRKFKIAVTGALRDRAVTEAHDIGLRLVEDDAGRLGFEVLVGGGMGRTPVIGKVLREFLPDGDLLSYLQAIMRVYNLEGRRDNKYKARIKILVNALGIDEFRRRVEAEWQVTRQHVAPLDRRELDEVRAHFAPPPYRVQVDTGRFEAKLEADPEFAGWVRFNTVAHRQSGYRAVFVSLKSPDSPPGDMTARQMRELACLANRFSFGLIRASHDQNLLLADVALDDLYALWVQLDGLDLATPNIGTLTDMICCPGLDFCGLANAESISVARQINDLFDDMDYLHDLGDVRIKISGCMNACGHHHVGHIGILGVDKKGEEWYQITIGGSAEERTRLGRRLGPAVPKADVARTVAGILDVFAAHRTPGEAFPDVVERIGVTPFRDRVYGGDRP